MVLVHDHLIFQEIFDVFVVRLLFPQGHPPDMGIPKPFFDAVRVYLGIHLAVMVAVTRGPGHRRLLKRRRSEEKDQKLDDRICLESSVGVIAVVTDRDSHSRRHDEE